MVLACKAFEKQFKETGAPTVGSFAPGRINLIGEHIDYCDGGVLPMAIGFKVHLHRT